MRLSSPDLAAAPPSVLGALRQALGLLRRAARYLLLSYGLNLALSALLAAVVFEALRTSLGASLAGERMREGWDARWYEAFAVQAQGTASTFRPSVAGAGGVLDALDGFVEGFAALIGRGPGTGILLVAALYLVSSSFLGAALLGTFAARPFGAGFLQRGGHWFPRLLPLTVTGLLFYAAALGPARLWLDGRVDRALHDVVDERVRFAWVLAAHAGLWALIALGNLVLDYAKALRVLREDAGGAIAACARALAAAAALVWRRPALTIGLYAVTALAGLAALVAYVAVVPGAAGGSRLAVMATFLLGQLFVLSRIALRALFLAGEVAVAAGEVASGDSGRADVPSAAPSDVPPVAQAV